jgi:hypothetical protein
MATCHVLRGRPQSPRRRPRGPETGLPASASLDLALVEAREAYEQAAGQVDPWKLGSLAIWLWRLGAGIDLPPGLPEPHALEIGGDWQGAAASWERLGRTYDAALTRIISARDEAGLRASLTVLDNLGARATAAAARRRMNESGVTSIPRGPRPATRAAPAGLTAASRRSWPCCHRACRTRRSPGGCSFPSEPCTTMSPPSCPKSVSRPGWPLLARPRTWASGPRPRQRGGRVHRDRPRP